MPHRQGRIDSGPVIIGWVVGGSHHVPVFPHARNDNRGAGPDDDQTFVAGSYRPATQHRNTPVLLGTACPPNRNTCRPVQTAASPAVPMRPGAVAIRRQLDVNGSNAAPSGCAILRTVPPISSTSRPSYTRTGLSRSPSGERGSRRHDPWAKADTTKDAVWPGVDKGPTEVFGPLDPADPNTVRGLPRVQDAARHTTSTHRAGPALPVSRPVASPHDRKAHPLNARTCRRSCGPVQVCG